MNSRGMATWLRLRSERDPDRSALTFADETFSYAVLQSRIVQFATFLSDNGVANGDRVAYLGFNHSSFLVSFFATTRLGAVFVPLNFRLTLGELAYAIEDSGALTLIADAAHADKVDAISAQLPVKSF